MVPATMLEQALDFPRQLRSGLRAGDAAGMADRRPAAVALCGLGGSAAWVGNHSRSVITRNQRTRGPRLLGARAPAVGVAVWQRAPGIRGHAARQGAP